MAAKIIDACCLIKLYSTCMEATILRACAAAFYEKLKVKTRPQTVSDRSDARSFIREAGARSDLRDERDLRDMEPSGTHTGLFRP